jgi:PilZ domain
MRANWPAELRSASIRIPCHVIDISVGGAKLNLARPLPRDLSKIWLVIEPFGPIYGEPVWQRHNTVGLRFFRDQPDIARLQMRRFAASAWIDVPEGTGCTNNTDSI